MSVSSTPDGSRSGPAFFSTVLLAGVFFLHAYPGPNYDIWWHLASGRRILDDGSIPRHETFSHAMQGEEWIDFEWLFQIIVYGVEFFGGVAGLECLRLSVAIAGALLLIATLPAASLPRERLWNCRAVFFAAALLGLEVRSELRAELFVYAYIPLFLLMLDRLGRAAVLSQARWPVYTGMSVLAVVWTNTHGSFPLMLVLAAIRTVRWVPTVGLSGATRLLVGTSLCCLGGSLVNPYGIELWVLAFDHMRDPEIRLVIEEWRPPEFERRTVFFWSLVGISAVYFPWRWARRLGRIEPYEAVTLVVFAGLALRSVRHVAIFAWMVLPLLWPGVLAFWEYARRPTRIALAVVSGWLLLHPAYDKATGIRTIEREPEGAVDFLENNAVVGLMYNEDKFGGYLAWRMPDRKIFFDGRYNLFRPVVLEAWAAASEPERWSEFLARYGVTYSVEGYPRAAVPAIHGGHVVAGSAFRNWRYPVSDWALVWWDDVSFIFLRRTPDHAELINRYEYRYLDPTNLDVLELMLRLGEVNSEDLWEEWRRHEADVGFTRSGLLVREWLERATAPRESRRNG